MEKPSEYFCPACRGYHPYPKNRKKDIVTCNGTRIYFDDLGEPSLRPQLPETDSGISRFVNPDLLVGLIMGVIVGVVGTGDLYSIGEIDEDSTVYWTFYGSPETTTSGDVVINRFHTKDERDEYRSDSLPVVPIDLKMEGDRLYYRRWKTFGKNQAWGWQFLAPRKMPVESYPE